MKLPNNTQQAFCVVKALLITIIKFVRELWFMRNQHIHNPHPTGVITFKLLEDIQHIYNLKQNRQETDQIILPPQYLQQQQKNRTNH